MGVPNQTMMRPMQAATKNATYTGTAGVVAAMPTSTQAVRLLSTTNCFIEITAAGTAAVAATAMPLAAYAAEYFPANAGDIVSAIQETTGGTIYVTPFS